MMKNTSILIIGAGAAGLMAANDLSAGGLDVTILEAAAGPGGRIRTLTPAGFPEPVDAGAEFVHGDLQMTLELLKDAHISYREGTGGSATVRSGEWSRGRPLAGAWSELIEEMGKLNGDMPLEAFLEAHFGAEKQAGIRKSAGYFAEGFDLADIAKASTISLYHEWTAEDHANYRPEGGYGGMIDHLAARCEAQGCNIRYSSPVKRVEWEKGRVELVLEDGDRLTGTKLVFTGSAGVLQAAAAGGEAVPLRFVPDIRLQLDAATRIGFGSVVKILASFGSPLKKMDFPDTDFLLSDQPVPTWWRGWAGNDRVWAGWLPESARRRLPGGLRMSAEGLKEAAMSSLAGLFERSREELSADLKGMHVADWSAEPYIRGGYSYDTVDSAAARKCLREPVAETLYFAGEALYEGRSPGTVEAALVSGRDAADRIFQGFRRL